MTQNQRYFVSIDLKQKKTEDVHSQPVETNECLTIFAQ